jgi:hypothetical protein
MTLPEGADQEVRYHRRGDQRQPDSPGEPQTAILDHASIL